jgi:hypothetical protein
VLGACVGRRVADGVRGPRRRLSAQANEADIRVVPEPGLVLVLVSGLALLAVLNLSCTKQANR